MYDMYPWGDPADSGSAEPRNFVPRHVPAAAIRAVQVALDRRDNGGDAVAAVAAILGHVFPIWLGFRGGKGVASALGVFLALSPAAAGCTFAIFLVLFLITRYVSLASVVGSAFFPFFGLYFVPYRTPIVIAGFLFIPLLIIVKHRENIRRLLNGTENRFGKKKAAA